MKNLRTTIKPLTAAVASAIVITAFSANVSSQDADPILAEPLLTVPANRIKQNYPGYEGPTDMATWLSEADVYALNPVNLRGGKFPDREDPEGGPYDVVYIFPDAATANAWWDPVANPTGMPTGIPADAVALIHWELDNGSGSFPGVMSKSDIDGFKSRNCIMAAGDTIPFPGIQEGIEKTCSNPQGASKRFKLNIIKPNVPVDLVYNVEPWPLDFYEYSTLPTFDGQEEAGRIYRILQKFHNTSGIDATDNDGNVIDDREGIRMAGFRLELGYGVGTDAPEDGGFGPIPNAYLSDGLEPDKTLGFELRPCMPDHFLDIFRERPGTGTNPCSTEFDNNVVDFPADPDDPASEPGQPLPQEIWLEEEYASFSPKNFSFRDDKRIEQIGIPGGFWDKAPSGVYPPERQQLGRLDSGYQDASSDVYWDSRVDDPDLIMRPAPGTYFGATVPNYWDMVTTQGENLYDGDSAVRTPGLIAEEFNTGNITPPFPMGYLMHYGVLSEPFEDVEIMPYGLFSDDDGLPSSEGDMIAWWDGSAPDCCFRWGIDGEVYDGVIEPAEAFSTIDPEQVKEWALYPLVEDCNETDETAADACPAGPLYEVGVIDDLGGLNVDSFVYLGRNYDPVANPTFTVRLTMVSVDNPDPYGDGTPPPTGFPVAADDPSVADGPWVLNPAPSLESLINDDGIISIQEPAIVAEPLVIVLGDTDAGVVTPGTETVTVRNDSTGETEEVTLNVTDPEQDWRFEGILETDPNAAAGTSGDDRLNTWPGQSVTVTYIDANTGVDADGDGELDTNVEKTDTVIIQPPELFEFDCTDGIDNDGDGLIDAADPDCDDPTVIPSDLQTTDGGFCSYNPNGRFDPVLPALVLIGLGYLGLRRKGLTSK